MKRGREWIRRTVASRTWLNPSVAGARAATTDITKPNELSTMIVVAGVLVGTGALSQQHERLAPGCGDLWQLSWDAGG